MDEQSKAEDFLPEEFLDAELIGSLEQTYRKEETEWKVYDIGTEHNQVRSYKSRFVYFLNSEWRLLLFGRFYGDSVPTIAGEYEILCLVLLRHVKRYCPVKYTLHWKKLDGSVEKLISGIMNEGQDHSDYSKINIQEMRLLKAQFAPSDSYSLTFTMTLESCTLNKSEHMKLRMKDTLSRNFNEMFTNEINCDITLSVKGKVFKAHKDVLVARSAVFAAMFQNKIYDSQLGEIVISDCDPNTFEDFLKFLYSGQMQDLTPPEAIHMYETSEIYDVQEVKIFCRELLMENISINEFCEVATLGYKYNDEALMSAAQEFFKVNLREIFQTPKWESLMKDNSHLSNKLLKGLPNLEIAE